MNTTKLALDAQCLHEYLGTCPNSLVVQLSPQGLLRISMHRPTHKNALLPDMYVWLARLFDLSNSNDAVKVLLLQGSNNDFTAGNDLSAFEPEAINSIDSPAFVFLRSVATLAKPLVCAVQGVAIGIGTTVLLHADLVFAESNCRFQLPFTRLGLVPEGAATLLLPQRAGYLLASRLLLLAEMFDATTALQAGLINQVVDNALDAALTAATQLLSLPSKSLLSTKALVKSHQDTHKVIKAIDAEASLFVQRTQEPDLIEALAAFKQKRPAVFS